MFDQLNTPALLAFEVLGRRIQLIESAYELSADGKSPDFFHIEDIMGCSERTSGAVIAPTLEQEAATRLRARAENSEELRKAKDSFKGNAKKPGAEAAAK